MEIFFENTLLLGFVGGALTGLLIYAGIHLGQVRILLGGVSLLVLTLLLVGLSWWVETDREILRRTLNEIAQAVRDNNHSKVFSYIHPNASAGLRHAKGELPKYRFHQASVTSLRDIIVNDRTRPPTAITEFIAVLRLSSDNPHSFGAEFNVRRLVKVYWMKHEKRWMVYDYEHADFMQAFTYRDEGS